MPAHPIARRRTALFFLSIALPLTVAAQLAAGDARAEEPEPAPVLGRPGQLVLGELVGVRSGVPALFAGLNSGGLSSVIVVSDVGWGGIVGYSRVQGSRESVLNGAVQHTTDDTESVWVAPAADIFVTPRISIGLSAGVLWARRKTISEPAMDAYWHEGISAAVSPRVGYLVPLGRGLSFWPRVGVAFSYSEYSTGRPVDGWYAAGRSRGVSGNVDLALAYHPIPRLLFKLAPQIGVGRTFTEAARADGEWSSSEATSVRIGGEATAGIVF